MLNKNFSAVFCGTSDGDNITTNDISPNYETGSTSVAGRQDSGIIAMVAFW